ncbi:hypothetical protein N182_34185 [Sinorhizobium sp. GL2]|nr:hypothetical protein N182_34185 [Sinorhizobium sp. GL2]
MPKKGRFGTFFRMTYGYARARAAGQQLPGRLEALAIDAGQPIPGRKGGYQCNVADDAAFEQDV